jgi:ABC-type nitrate/sulfonate/bicarbonate transport system substrate-binding protein
MQLVFKIITIVFTLTSRITFKAVFIYCLMFFFYTTSVFAQNNSSDKAILQLKWKNQFQFAGYYAAVEKGFYKEVGINVEIKEPNNNTSPVEEVLEGKAQYGIGSSELIVEYMKGEPIVVLACIMQNSPSVLMVKASSKINGPKDLVGKIIEMDTDQSGIEIMAMLAKEGVRSDQFKTIHSTFSLNNFLANSIDALEVYTTNEPYFLDKFGIPYRLILPRNYGINFYTECLFTSMDELRENPVRVRNFRNASIKGWKYALSHPEEIANIIQTKYHSTKTLEHLMFEAEEMRRLINPDFIEVGHSNKERWLNIVELLSQQGLIKEYRNIDNFIYNPNELSNSRNTKILILIIFTLALGISILGYNTFKLRKVLSINSSKHKMISTKNDLQKEEIIRLKKELNIRKENHTSYN